MAEQQQPEALPVAALCRRCQEETARYRGHQPPGGGYCLEMIRRAVVAQDQACWSAMVEIYHDQVFAWCRRISAAQLDPAEVVNQVWERFWRNYTAEKLEAAGSSAAVLQYLKMVTASVVADAQRSQMQRQLAEIPEDLTDPSPPVAEQIVDQAVRDQFWQAVGGLMRSERERQLVSLHWMLGLRSAEVQARRPDLFPTVTSVYRTARNIMERLRRDEWLRRWIDSEKE